MDNEFVVAECGIRQLHARCVDAVWRKDAEAFAACFAEQGEWKIAGLHMRGRTAIVATFGRLLGICERVVLTAGTPVLEIEKGAAIGRVQCVEFAKMMDGTSAMTVGIYYDRYVEEAGRWRFKWRHWAMQYRGPTDLSAQFQKTTDYGPFPNMPGPDEPTFSRKPSA
jgi:uncharacterized protein (TIGR02246 family)